MLAMKGGEQAASWVMALLKNTLPACFVEATSHGTIRISSLCSCHPEEEAYFRQVLSRLREPELTRARDTQCPANKSTRKLFCLENTKQYQSNSISRALPGVVVPLQWLGSFASAPGSNPDIP